MNNLPSRQWAGKRPCSIVHELKRDIGFVLIEIEIIPDFI